MNQTGDQRFSLSGNLTRRFSVKSPSVNSKVLSLLEACFDLISPPSLYMKIQIMGGKIIENLEFVSPLRKVKNPGQKCNCFQKNSWFYATKKWMMKYRRHKYSEWPSYIWTNLILKFIYSEKATKFCEIFPLLLTAVQYSQK